MRALVLVAALVAAPAAAQTFQPTPPVTIDVLGNAELVGRLTLTPATPGDELLFRNRLWRHVVFVAVLHPTKSGPLGVVPAPGLCLEAAQAFAAADVAITIADVTGDGVDDVVGMRANGEAQVLQGIGLSACR